LQPQGTDLLNKAL